MTDSSGWSSSRPHWSALLAVALGGMSMIEPAVGGERTSHDAATGSAPSLTAETGRWVRVQEHAAFNPRDTGENAVFAGKMWMSNGWAPKPEDKMQGIDTRDLWNSTDGVTWTRVSDATPYDVYSELVVFKENLWAIKGSVWKSTDGVRWEKVLDKTPFGARGYGEAVVFQDKIWQLGSGTDIWTSADGIEWTSVTPNAPYGHRYATAVTAFGDKLWVMAGSITAQNTPVEKGYKNFTTFNDVWSSADGQIWTRECEHAPWPARMWSIATVYAGRLWLIGGYDNRNRHNLGDVWTTTDGRKWEEFQSPTHFAPRHEVTPYVYDGSLWVVAGNTWPVVNDVWRLTLPQGSQTRQ